MGPLNRLAREHRADGGGRRRRSQLQQALGTLTYDDVKEINQLAKHMKDTAEQGIAARSVPLEEPTRAPVSDASLHDSSRGGSYGA
eukprot:5188819-Pyramimonas_sp.AAC.1